jgi:hypothetical protein
MAESQPASVIVKEVADRLAEEKNKIINKLNTTKDPSEIEDLRNQFQKLTQEQQVTANNPKNGQFYKSMDPEDPKFRLIDNSNVPAPVRKTSTEAVPVGPRVKGQGAIDVEWTDMADQKSKAFADSQSHANARLAADVQKNLNNSTSTIPGESAAMKAEELARRAAQDIALRRAKAPAPTFGESLEEAAHSLKGRIKGMSTPAKVGVGIGAAALGFTAWLLATKKDEIEETTNQLQEPPPPPPPTTTSSSSTTKEEKEIPKEETPPAPKPTISNYDFTRMEKDLNAIDSEIKNLTANGFKDLDTTGFDKSQPDQKRMLDAMEELAQATKAAQNVYEQEKSSVNSKAMWDGILKGLLQIGAGIYGMKNNLDMGGVKLSPTDWTAQFEAAKTTLDASMKGAKQKYDSQLQYYKDDVEALKYAKSNFFENKKLANEAVKELNDATRYKINALQSQKSNRLSEEGLKAQEFRSARGEQADIDKANTATSAKKQAAITSAISKLSSKQVAKTDKEAEANKKQLDNDIRNLAISQNSKEREKAWASLQYTLGTQGYKPEDIKRIGDLALGPGIFTSAKPAEAATEARKLTQGAPATPAPSAAAPSSSAKVKMKNKHGAVMEIPAHQVQEGLAKGLMLVE